MDLRPPLDPIFEAFGLPALVTPPAGPSVSTVGVWINPQTVDAPVGGEARIAEQHSLLALRRADVPSIPHGSRIDIAERGGTAIRGWRVDGFGRVQDEVIEVLLVPLT